jgi:hypothetical protein
MRKPSALSRVADLISALVITGAALASCLCLTWVGSRAVNRRQIQALTQAAAEINETDAGVSDLHAAGSALKDQRAAPSNDAGAATAEAKPLVGGGLMLGKPRFGIPPHMRWNIEFDQGMTSADFAQILDYFKIELGVVRAGQKITFAKDLSTPKPNTYEVSIRDEQRQYIRRAVGKLRDAENELIRRAGIANDGGVVHFLPSELKQTLLRLEEGFRGLDAERIRRTRFAIKQTDSAYEFYVADQTPLPPR